MKRLLSPARLLAPLLLVIPAMTTIPAGAEPVPLPTGLTHGETHNVIDVVDADTVRLDNLRQVRLVGLQGPKLPLGRPNYPTWPLAPEARAHLVKLIGDAPLTLHFGGAREDRHGRILAHLTTRDGAWIQGTMLAAGFARVYTFEDNRSLIPEMLALEDAARAAKRDFKNFGRGFDPKRFDGKLVRVRGWVEAVNGPSIDVTHPEQIQVLP